MTDGILCFSVPADLQSAGLGFGHLQSPKLLFLHNLVRKTLPVFQRHLHEILSWGEALDVQAFQALALRAHKSPLQVVELDLFGLHVGRVLQVESVLGGVGVIRVRTDEKRLLINIPQFILNDSNKNTSWILPKFIRTDCHFTYKAPNN